MTEAMIDRLRELLPPHTRLILAAEELLGQFGTRTEDGRRITAEWGEPSAEGWYEPTFTATDDGKVVVDRDAHDRMAGALRRLVDAVDDYAPRDTHDWRCEYRTAEAGWVPGAPPVIRCACGYDELAEAMGAALPLIGAAPEAVG